MSKKKSDIDNRMVEIQNELNLRADEINKKKTAVEDAKTKRGKIKGR